MSDIIIIEGSKYTPRFCLDKKSQKISITGISRPENCKEFYDPLFVTINDFFLSIINKPQKEVIIIDFYLLYFNTSSAKYLTDILLNAKNLKKDNIELIINWRYPDDDINALEDGKDLAFSTDLEFNFIPENSINL